MGLNKVVIAIQVWCFSVVNILPLRLSCLTWQSMTFYHDFPDQKWGVFKFVRMTGSDLRRLDLGHLWWNTTELDHLSDSLGETKCERGLQISGEPFASSWRQFWTPNSWFRYRHLTTWCHSWPLKEVITVTPGLTSLEFLCVRFLNLKGRYGYAVIFRGLVNRHEDMLSWDCNKIFSLPSGRFAKSLPLHR